MTESIPDLTPEAIVTSEILSRAEDRRSARRYSEAAFEDKAWVALVSLYDNEQADPALRALAGETLRRYRSRFDIVVAELPPLETSDDPMVALVVDERFGIFHTYGFLRNLDLWRHAHRTDVPDWHAADVLQTAIDLLLEELASIDQTTSPQFICVALERQASNCQMALEYISETGKQHGFAYLSRTTAKAVIIDMETGNVIKLAKRTEFIIDLSKVDSRFKESLDRWGIDLYNLAWNSEGHALMEQLVTIERHLAIRPVYTTLFAYRGEQPEGYAIELPSAVRRAIRPLTLDPTMAAEDAAFRAYKELLGEPLDSEDD